LRYFHRTSVSPDVVFAEADRFFTQSLATAETGLRTRLYSGAIGRIDLTVGMEGGHYTRITIETDQVGESEADKLAKRFLAVVHRKAEPEHALRGAY
jgi:hypothetical protein